MAYFDEAKDELVRLGFTSEEAKKILIINRSNVMIIDPKTKKCICSFVRYLRKEFYFPIRCNVYFCNQEKFRSSKGGYCYGVFISYDESNKRPYPQIYIPTKQCLRQIYHSLCHELTHYFQWYFFDDKNKTDRSLEIQASKYASRIDQDYCWYHCKEPDSSCKSCCGK